MGFAERALAALKGELPDTLPYAPRLDLWYAGCRTSGTLPREHEEKTVEEICRSEGWGIYRLTTDCTHLSDSAEDMAMTCLGLFTPPEAGFKLSFGDGVRLECRRKGFEVHISLLTEAGSLEAVVELNPGMLRRGITVPWVKRPLIQRFDDWKLVATAFESLTVVPDLASYWRVQELLGGDGVAVSPACDAASPMHHIQKWFFGGTEFFVLYHDRRAELEEFAASVGHFYERLLVFYADAPVEAVMWGGNFDSAITYPPYFEAQILPWLSRAANVLRPRRVPLLTHCDGENRKLMDLVRRSGVDAAESVCPYPMTSLTLREYYVQWSADLCIVGGIPAEYVIPERTSEDELLGYMDYLLRAVAPGRRFIAGITDAVPPSADFDRLRRIQEVIDRRGRLPLSVGPIPDVFAAPETMRASQAPRHVAEYAALLEAVGAGDGQRVAGLCRQLLVQGRAAADILEDGLIAAMDVIGWRFAVGEAFVPDVLLAARAIEAGVQALEGPLDTAEPPPRSAGIVLLGTVKGDLHDIGKNLVAVVLRAAGFKVIDLGTDVTAGVFVDKATELRPHIVGMSALLTTTMPEMERVVRLLTEAGVRDDVRVIVGGAPVTERFAADICADGYGESALDAVSVARRLVAAGARGTRVWEDRRASAVRQ
jgi:methylmalonyl-CoA mutase cobalamin-binding domain/chain